MRRNDAKKIVANVFGLFSGGDFTSAFLSTAAKVNLFFHNCQTALQHRLKKPVVSHCF
jgi:hypothetical protein